VTPQLSRSRERGVVSEEPASYVNDQHCSHREEEGSYRQAGLDYGRNGQWKNGYSQASGSRVPVSPPKRRILTDPSDGAVHSRSCSIEKVVIIVELNAEALSDVVPNKFEVKSTIQVPPNGVCLPFLSQLLKQM
jgi:hypothetical protein